MRLCYDAPMQNKVHGSSTSRHGGPSEPAATRRSGRHQQAPLGVRDGYAVVLLFAPTLFWGLLVLFSETARSWPYLHVTALAVQIPAGLIAALLLLSTRRRHPANKE